MAVMAANVAYAMNHEERKKNPELRGRPKGATMVFEERESGVFMAGEWGTVWGLCAMIKAHAREKKHRIAEKFLSV